MKSAFRQYWYLAAVAVLLFASASFGQVNMVLTGVNGANEGGVYTDPYYGTVNGVPAVIISDDYADDSYVPESWRANAINESQAGASLATSTPVKWNAGSAAATQLLYDEISYLATAMLAAAPGQAQMDYSFAIWDLSCQAGVTASVGKTCTPPVAPSDLSTVANLILQAQNASKNFTPGEFANVTIYTPLNTNPGQGTCGTGPCATTPPQEFISVPEASTLALVALGMLGLLALAFMFRQRGLQLAS